jgi:hypothetical protein
MSQKYLVSGFGLTSVKASWQSALSVLSYIQEIRNVALSEYQIKRIIDRRGVK